MERLTHLLNAEAVWFTTLLTMLILVSVDQIAIRVIPACRVRDEDGEFTFSAKDHQSDVHIMTVFVGLISTIIVGLLTNGIIWPVWVFESAFSEPITLLLLATIPLLSMCILIHGVKDEPEGTSMHSVLCMLPMLAVVLAATSMFVPNSKVYETEQVKGYNSTEYTRLLPTYKTVERYTGKTLEQAVIYENDQNITVEVYVNDQWVDVSTITTPDQLPATDTTNYHVKRGYTTLDVPDITQTVIDTIDKKVAGITPEYIPYVKLRITKVIVATDERQHVIPTDETNVRSTDTAQRIHIEYEVTNVTDVQAMMKDKTSDEDALKQLITPKPKGE